MELTAWMFILWVTYEAFCSLFFAFWRPNFDTLGRTFCRNHKQSMLAWFRFAGLKIVSHIHWWRVHETVHSVRQEMKRCTVECKFNNKQHKPQNRSASTHRMYISVKLIRASGRSQFPLLKNCFETPFTLFILMQDGCIALYDFARMPGGNACQRICEFGGISVPSIAFSPSEWVFCYEIWRDPKYFCYKIWSYPKSTLSAWIPRYWTVRAYRVNSAWDVHSAMSCSFMVPSQNVVGHNKRSFTPTYIAFQVCRCWGWSLVHSFCSDFERPHDGFKKNEIAERLTDSYVWAVNHHMIYAACGSVVSSHDLRMVRKLLALQQWSPAPSLW